MSTKRSRGSSPRRRVAAAAAGLALTLGATLASREAGAQALDATNGDGFDLRLFRPAVDSKGQFSVNGTDILGHLDPAFGLVIDYGRELARLGAGPGGVTNRALVDNYFTGTFLANLGLANWLVVGLSLPVALVNGPGSAGLNVAGYSPPMNGLNAQNVGELALNVKFRFLRSERTNFGAAIILQGATSLGDGPRSFIGDPGFSLWPQLALEWRPTRIFRMDLNVGFRWFSGRGSTLPQPSGSVTYGFPLTAGLGASVRVGDAVDIVAETYLSTYTNQFFAPNSTPWEVVGGLKIFVQRNSYLMLGAGTRIPFGDAPAGSNVRAFLGFIFEPSIGDTDGDGYRDDVDRCPTQPEDFDHFEDEDGCPDPDNDHDRIPDTRDRCPNDPETYNGTDDDDGCPDNGQVVVEEGQIRILQAINFETNSARIRPDSIPIVEAVARTLNGNPQISLVQVQGHADERGDDDHNLRLTIDRAASVVEALVERGVTRERLHSAGYGERCRAGYPATPGQPEINAVCQSGGPRWCHSERAWAHDRRVVFLILRTTDGPTGVRVVCDEAADLIPEADRQYHNGGTQ